jgi:YHS domain-containing protein
MTKFIALLIFLLFMRYLLSRVMAALLPPSAQRKSASFRGGAKTIRGEMMKDPNCGMYVARDLAVTVQTREGYLSFCSEECRKEYLQKRPTRG